MTNLLPEPRLPVAMVDWCNQTWRTIEYQNIKRLARGAGAYAYQGPAWPLGAIRKEARAFLITSPLLSPHQNDGAINRLVIGNFIRGWRHREQKEAQP
jgi:hypothetical protein